MSVNTKRVFYVKYLADPVYAEILAARDDVRLDRLDNESPHDVAAPILAAAHVYQIGSARDEIARRFHVNAALIAGMADLLVVSTSGVGYDTVDVGACTDAGILVVNQAGGNREAVAEHALGMLIALSKRIGETNLVMRRERLAELTRGLFAMKVLTYDPYLTAAVCTERGAEKVELADLMRRSDYVSINCPLTEETRGMVGAAEFALMRRGAFLITTARGHIHDEAALADALARRQLAGAGLDVWAAEPPPCDHPLLKFDNVLVSPHTAGVTRETRRNMGRIAAEQVLDALDGKPVARKVNPEVWPRYAQRFTERFGFEPRE